MVSYDESQGQNFIFDERRNSDMGSHDLDDYIPDRGHPTPS
jgi:hypothetical protein